MIGKNYGNIKSRQRSAVPNKTKNTEDKALSQPTLLNGQCLIAMPGMLDNRFVRAVVYLCNHDQQGAMGLVINRLFGSLDFTGLLEQLNIAAAPKAHTVRVHYGGPVETGRGFVLHTLDWREAGTLQVGKAEDAEQFGMTATVDILRALASGSGPQRCLLALGYAGWAAGQLEQEIQANGWLTAPADPSLLFDANLDNKWERALAKIGVSAAMLNAEAGHA